MLWKHVTAFEISSDYESSAKIEELNSNQESSPPERDVSTHSG